MFQQLLDLRIVLQIVAVGLHCLYQGQTPLECVRTSGVVFAV